MAYKPQYFNVSKTGDGIPENDITKTYGMRSSEPTSQEVKEFNSAGEGYVKIVQAPPKPITIFTCGYGGLKSFDELKALLDKNGVTKLIDIRSIPYSRKWKKDDLTWNKADLEAYFGARYIHRPTMGGKGFEPQDYNRWKEVAKDALTEISALAGIVGEVVAIMCTEKNWKKCHRNYLAGRWFQEAGFKVVHL